MNAPETDPVVQCRLSLQDFSPLQGWGTPERTQQRSRWCCERLEEGHILMLETLPFELPDSERNYLLAQPQGDSSYHKNISYRPLSDQLHGFAAKSRTEFEQMRQIMCNYSTRALQFLGRLLAPYANNWTVDYASFRPESEQDRKLPLRKRNDLLHIDAFPSRPTQGRRILRCFTNINLTQPRVWQTTELLPDLLREHAQKAGLSEIAARGMPPFQRFGDAVKRAIGLNGQPRTPYDRFMLRFHDYLKQNSAFQQACPKVRLEFPPGATWLCFTDTVPHAVVSGQFALEQTVIVPLSALLKPQDSPLRRLESLAGRTLVETAG